MSLEQFRQTHPATPELKEIMENKKQRVGYPYRSLVGLLAMDITEAGGEGLRELTKRFGQSGVALDFDQTLFKQMDPVTRSVLIQHHAAIIFGVSVVGIEDTLRNMEFDRSQWRDRYNMALTGTPFRGMSMGGEDIEVLSGEQQSALVSYAAKDKTFAIFFNEGMRNLPVGMRLILEQSSRLQQIRVGVIPIYLERARFLIDGGT